MSAKDEVRQFLIARRANITPNQAGTSGWIGQTASLEPVTWEQFRRTTPSEHAENS